MRLQISSITDTVGTCPFSESPKPPLFVSNGKCEQSHQKEVPEHPCRESSLQIMYLVEILLVQIIVFNQYPVRDRNQAVKQKDTFENNFPHYGCIITWHQCPVKSNIVANYKHTTQGSFTPSVNPFFTQEGCSISFDTNFDALTKTPGGQ